MVFTYQILPARRQNRKLGLPQIVAVGSALLGLSSFSQAFDIEEELARDLAAEVIDSGDYHADVLSQVGALEAVALPAISEPAERVLPSRLVNLKPQVSLALREIESAYDKGGLDLRPVVLAVDNLSDPAFENQAFPNLRTSIDPVMQAALNELSRDPEIARAVAEQRFSAALVDITDPTAPAMASINGDMMMYAASLPKIAILLGAFEKAAVANETLDEASIETLTKMIRVSSNRAATEMYYDVGPERLAEILQSPKYRLYDAKDNGGLWVGKPYAKQTTWKRDPLHNISHGATALQVARFFYLLETGRLVSNDASRAMKTMLGQPAIAHKFVKGLRAHKPGSRIFRKSGTWRTYHADAGIVERNGRRYIAVMMANDVRGGSWLSDLIVDFDGVIHQRNNRFASIK